MSMLSRVLVCGASPDNQNRNVVLRSYVAEGFWQLRGIESVVNVPLEHAATKAWSAKPELVVCFGSCMPDDADYSGIKRYCAQTGATLVFWLHDDPYEFDFSYKIKDVADLVFSNDKWCTEHYDHPRAFHLPLAASERAHWRPISATKDVNIFFCGVAFGNRIKLLRDLAKPLQEQAAVVLGDGWPESELPFCRNQRLPNNELSDRYARAWITLNMGATTITPTTASSWTPPRRARARLKRRWRVRPSCSSSRAWRSSITTRPAPRSCSTTPYASSASA